MPSTTSGIVDEYAALKRETDADLLAMQMGDFYEFFCEDAGTVGDEIDLKVTERSAGGGTYRMAGVPVDDLTPHLKALVERGYRVAVADQRETDHGHERELVRLVTPGTLLETTDDDARYLATIVREGSGRDTGVAPDDDTGVAPDDGTGVAPDRDSTYGLAFVDVTTGRFHVTELDGDDAGERVFTELYRFEPVEVLPGPAVRTDDAVRARLNERVDGEVTLHDPDAFAPGRARHAVADHFGDETAESVGLAAAEPAVRAAGAALSYVEDTGVGALASVSRLRAYGADDHVELDATTQRTLELTDTMTGSGRTVFGTIDHTVTSAGGRQLKAWLTRPLRDRAELERRQSAVEALAEDAMARERLLELLGDTYDLERVASRAASGSADARSLLRVRETLGLVPDLAETVESSPRLADSPVAAVLSGLDREAAADLHGELAAALADDPPATVTDGGLIKRGYDDELDDLIERHEAAVQWIEELEAREKRRHGFSRLTVDRNKTDGYYLQVPKSERDAVPDEYEGIKTLKNAERYVHPELERKEREILRLEERRSELEHERFRELRGQVATHAELLQAVGQALAELDALASLAVHAVRNDWTRPDLVAGGELDIEAGRHPVVEQTTEFVPNDLSVDRDRRFLIVTGPNMSGKSTYMRQTALIVLLAQIGSFVPARSARVGLVDGIYTRVGALDELAEGRSTFMVEMQELSNILHSATEDSLVILDEVGRGTATYDGISIAWAATEYLNRGVDPTAPAPTVLFATHYHELTTLADHLDGVANVHVAVDEDGATRSGGDGDVTFLRNVRDGPADRSYGIHVAKLAGVPDPVVQRAREVLRTLREDEAIAVRGSGGTGSADTHQVVFDLGSGQFRGSASADGGSSADEGPTGDGPTGDGPTGDGPTGDGPVDKATETVLEDMRRTNVNELAPVELVGRVREWQQRLEDDQDTTRQSL